MLQLNGALTKHSPWNSSARIIVLHIRVNSSSVSKQIAGITGTTEGIRNKGLSVSSKGLVPSALKVNTYYYTV